MRGERILFTDLPAPYQQEHSHLQMHTKFLVSGIPSVLAALVTEGSTQGLHLKKWIRQKLFEVKPA
jgi:hypothetical protein